MLPELSLELIEALESLFVDRCPGIHDSEREIFFHAGRVSVVKLLRSEYSIQNTPKEEIEEEDFIDVYIKTES